MRLMACSSSPVSEAEFVNYWASLYSSKPDEDDREYFEQLKKFADADGPEAKACLEILFNWKDNGRNRAGAFVDRVWNKIQTDGGLAVARAKNPRVLANELYKSGVIWPVFLVHCLRPTECPIFDQQVYRAMTFIEAGQAKELGNLRPDRAKFDCYFDQYVPFWKAFSPHAQDIQTRRQIDRALWAFGEFLKTKYAFMVK